MLTGGPAGCPSLGAWPYLQMRPQPGAGGSPGLGQEAGLRPLLLPVCP